MRVFPHLVYQLFASNFPFFPMCVHLTPITFGHYLVCSGTHLLCIVGHKAVRYSIVRWIGIGVVTQLGEHRRDFVHLVHNILDQVQAQVPAKVLHKVETHLGVGAHPGGQGVEVDGLDDLVAGPLHHGHPHLGKT